MVQRGTGGAGARAPLVLSLSTCLTERNVVETKKVTHAHFFAPAGRGMSENGALDQKQFRLLAFGHHWHNTQ
jgi:hypothetical protein